MHIQQSFAVVCPVRRRGVGFAASQPSLPSIWVVVPLLVLLLLTSAASHGQDVEPDGLLLDNVRLIVGDGAVLERGAMLIADGRIVSVGLRSEIDVEGNVDVLDLQGKTLVPAFIDSHAHLGYEAHRSWGASNYSRDNLVDHLQRYAYYGFSAVSIFQ